MRKFDAIVVGGGILGCFAARNLQKWNIHTLLIEGKGDVCTGITRANAAIVYAGYDNRVGSLKGAMTVRGNREFGLLCEELDVPFSRCGSFMVSFTEEGNAALEKKFRMGTANDVPGLALISGAEAKEQEPMLADGICKALYAPSTGTVNPWQLGIAAFENAVHNGCEAVLNAPVLSICMADGGYIVQTDQEVFFCRMLLNCAGTAADKIQEMVFSPSVRLFCDGADFLVMDKRAKSPRHIIFHQAAEHGKGITAIPTTEGNLLLGPTRRALGRTPYATTREGMDFLREDALRILPELDLSMTIRSFGAVRPNPHRVILKGGVYVPDGSSIGSFCIERPSENFISLMGIKTPGITCADQLGEYLAKETAAYLQASRKDSFDPIRTGIPKGSDEVLCQCEQISKSEVLEAIRRGAKTLDGIKRRVGSGMGRCQGSRCSYEIRKILEEWQNENL